MNARLMGVKREPATEGGQTTLRRPMTALTNTIMLGGATKDPKEIIGSVKKGSLLRQLWRPVRSTSCRCKFGLHHQRGLSDRGRQVGPEPVNGRTLIGAGSEAITRSGMVGQRPCARFPASASLGKDGQACRWASASDAQNR